jgi:hypothetical protein
VCAQTIERDAIDLSPRCRARPRTAPVSRRQPGGRERTPAELATRRAIRARDAGLRRISAVTRGIIAAVVALSGALAVLAANSFHGHTLVSRTTQRQLSAPAAPVTAAARNTSRPGSSARRSASDPASAPSSGSPSTQTTQTQTAVQTSPAAATQSQTQTTPAAGSSPGLAQPSQAPVQTPAPPVAVSGGS